MILGSEICIECAGRLHQLFDFNSIKTIQDTRKEKRINEKIGVVCSFCHDRSTIDDHFKQKAEEVIADTKWVNKTTYAIC